MLLRLSLFPTAQVSSTAKKARDELYKAVRHRVKEIRVIGDAFCPRLAYEALCQAFDVPWVV